MDEDMTATLLRDSERERLGALVNGTDWAPIGTSEAFEAKKRGGSLDA